MNVFFTVQYFFNSKTRARIAQTMATFLAAQKQPWLSSEPCVSIQIRRGDKVRHTNITELDKLCEIWHKEGRSTNCNGGSCRDMGCLWPRETRWPALTLGRYLDAAQEHFNRMKQKKRQVVFVMTVRVIVLLNIDSHFFSSYRMMGLGWPNKARSTIKTISFLSTSCQVIL